MHLLGAVLAILSGATFALTNATGRRGVITGTPTWGKGLVQTVYGLPYDGALGLTTASYYTPSGRSIQERGITPDVWVKAAAADEDGPREQNLPGHFKGEDVAAAVVLKEGAVLSERELQDFANARLAAFKVPRRILFLAEIPTGPTGKLQRIGLAQKLGLA